MRQPAIAAGALFVKPVGEAHRAALRFDAQVAVGIRRGGLKAQDGELCFDQHPVAEVGELVHTLEERVLVFGF